MTVFEQPGVFATWGMTSGDLPADQLVNRCLAAGVRWIAGQFDDGPNVANLPGLRDACAAAGVTYGVWDADPTPDRVRGALETRPGFYIAESEGAELDWLGIVEAVSLAGLDGAVVTNFSGLDDALLVDAGWACIPESYLPENPNADPAGLIGEATRRGYEVIAPCLGVYWEYPLLAYPPVWPFSIWNAETMTPADWDELALRTVPPPVEVEPEPEPEPEPGPPPSEPDWWEVPYKGGPMVKVKGFPRPLYPPDANEHGKKPSVDGPDVVAYKRTVSRAGRWPWQTFDDSYSNGFAHGKSGNVGETGVAGVQRQQKIDDSGWIGKATFNTLRSLRIPEGLPHAGEMAMDATAANLINQAWEMFGGHEPAPDQPGSVRAASLARAIAELGYVERPTNLTKYGDWYGMDGNPWCAMFVTWCRVLGAGDVGQVEESFVRGSRYAYVPYLVADARAGLNGLRTLDPDQAEPGDVVAFDWSWDGVHDHVGVVERWLDGNTFQSVEGNTSAADYSNGGQVMRQQRTLGQQGLVFIRVAEP